MCTGNETKKYHDLVICDVFNMLSSYNCQGFPGGAVVKNPPASAGDMGSSPGPGISRMPRSN